VRVRRVQGFFRAAVLTSYNHRCALTGLDLPELLTASHIIPWSESVERRADPRNGICLNSLFDRAFDRGLFTFDDDLRVVVSPRLRQATSNARLPCSLDDLEGSRLKLPDRFPPDREAVRYHREMVFQAG
jgi:predicted restriction endonuclease